MKRLRRKAWESVEDHQRDQLFNVPTIFERRNLSDSPAPFDEVGLPPGSMRVTQDYYHDELDDLYRGRMNPPNTNIDPEA